MTTTPSRSVRQPDNHGSLKAMLAEAESRTNDYLIRVAYKGEFVYLWRVTWESVVWNVTDRIDRR